MTTAHQLHLGQHCIDVLDVADDVIDSPHHQLPVAAQSLVLIHVVAVLHVLEVVEEELDVIVLFEEPAGKKSHQLFSHCQHNNRKIGAAVAQWKRVGLQVEGRSDCTCTWDNIHTKINFISLRCPRVSIAEVWPTTLPPQNV